MDVDKFNALTAIVKDAKAADKRAFDDLEKAKADWKSKNESLTAANKVLADFLAATVGEMTQ